MKKLTTILLVMFSVYAHGMFLFKKVIDNHQKNLNTSLHQKIRQTECAAVRTTAVKKNNGQIGQLLQSGANVNAIDQAFTPLIAAITAGSLSTVKLLIDAKADTNLTSYPTSPSPLHHAVMTRNPLIVALLIASGAHINRKCPLTPLEVAAQHDLAITQILMQHGACVTDLVIETLDNHLRLQKENNNPPVIIKQTEKVLALAKKYLE